LFAAVARALLPLPQSDPQAGLKGFGAAVVEAVVPGLHSDGFGLDCELLSACVELGLPVIEVPVRVRCEGAHSTTGLRSAVKALMEVWHVRRRRPGAVPATCLPVAALAPPAAPGRIAA
jgi:hypothetical protein